MWVEQVPEPPPPPLGVTNGVLVEKVRLSGSQSGSQALWEVGKSNFDQIGVQDN